MLLENRKHADIKQVSLVLAISRLSLSSSFQTTTFLMTWLCTGPSIETHPTPLLNLHPRTPNFQKLTLGLPMLSRRSRLAAPT